MDDERNVRRKKELGSLHDLLLLAAPTEGPDTPPSITTLARALKLSHWSVYLWIKKNKVPQNRVKAIVALSEGRVNETDFHPYLFT